MRRCLSMRWPFSARSVLESSSPMMRSESRTEDTSGLVTMTAASANRMASVAPRSMPAGLSQITQSNLARRSVITRATPSSVNASLSRVCEAGSSHSVSIRVSRISACGSLATPWTTLIRSNTTRRSAPITRSRLRSPTSKSTTTTDWPVCASAAPSAAVEVVLPTPPLPDVTTKTLAILLPFCFNPGSSLKKSSIQQRPSIQGFDAQPGILQRNLNGPAAQACIHVLGGLVVAVDGEQLGFIAAAENPRPRIASRARHGAAPQRPVDMDRSAGDDLGTRGDGAEHRHLAEREDHGLAGTDRRLDQHRGRFLARRRRARRGRGLGNFRGARLRPLLAARTAAEQNRRQLEPDRGGIDAFQRHDADAALGELIDQVGDSLLAECHGGQVENDRLAGEETGRIAGPLVELRQPIDDRRLGGQRKGQERAATEADRLLRLSCDVHGASCDSYQRVNPISAPDGRSEEHTSE